MSKVRSLKFYQAFVDGEGSQEKGRGRRERERGGRKRERKEEKKRGGRS